MALPEKKQKYYSYADYLSWDSRERWEIIEGRLYNLASPSDVHQELSVILSSKFYNYFQNKTCRVYTAPFDVSFPSDSLDGDDKVYDVVQPDIIIVCDKNKISRKGCRGAPDIVIEILSPSTASKDFIRKQRLYEKNKVKQYWIVDPEEKSVFVFKLNEQSQYSRPEEYNKEDKIQLDGFEGLEIDLAGVFTEK
ncbi:MAG: Uma2 family endonuclease [Candidatus Eremiobacterota bacterium]